jgi:branched-chain amino acid transport system ATP-binding protein
MFFEIKGLVVHYEKVEAVRGINILIKEGECVCIIGSNGAGKTTILKTIMGFKKPTAGEILFQGKRIDKLATSHVVIEGVSLVPEGRMVFPDMSVKDNLLMGAYLRKEKEGVYRGLEEIFQRFPILRERQKQLGGSLSGGEQQMLTIGRALMNKPKMLLLDEPTLGLAPVIVGQIAKVVKEINQAEISIILVEQNSHIALRVSQRGYVLETGNIVMEDQSSALIDNEYVKEAYLGGR